MFFKLSILAALVAPFVSALTVSAPTQPVTSGGSMTFTWQVANGDPATFSVYLTNPSFNDNLGIANSVDASMGTLTLAMPLVPEDEQYTIILVPLDNVNNVLAQSAPFTIGAITSTSASTTASTSVTGSRSVTSTAAVTTRSLPASSTFGTVVTSSVTRPASSAASSGASGASSGAAASASASNSAALPVRFNMNIGVVTSLVLSVVAGVAVAAV